MSMIHTNAPIAAEVLAIGRALLAADRAPTSEESALLQRALETTTEEIDRGALEGLESALQKQSRARSEAFYKAHDDLWTEFYSTQQAHNIGARTDPEMQRRFLAFVTAKNASK